MAKFDFGRFLQGAGGGLQQYYATRADADRREAERRAANAEWQRRFGMQQQAIDDRAAANAQRQQEWWMQQQDVTNPMVNVADFPGAEGLNAAPNVGPPAPGQLGDYGQMRLGNLAKAMALLPKQEDHVVADPARFATRTDPNIPGVTIYGTETRGGGFKPSGRVETGSEEHKKILGEFGVIPGAVGLQGQPVLNASEGSEEFENIRAIPTSGSVDADDKDPRWFTIGGEPVYQPMTLADRLYHSAQGFMVDRQAAGGIPRMVQTVIDPVDLSEIDIDYYKDGKFFDDKPWVQGDEELREEEVKNKIALAIRSSSDEEATYAGIRKDLISMGMSTDEISRVLPKMDGMTLDEIIERGRKLDERLSKEQAEDVPVDRDAAGYRGDVIVSDGVEYVWDDNGEDGPGYYPR